MELHPEIKAMNDILQALEALDAESRMRILNWAISKYSTQSNKTSDSLVNDSTGEQDFLKKKQNDVNQIQVDYSLIRNFTDIGEFYAQVNPKTDSEKVLAIGSYYQEAKGYDDLTGADLNRELKHLGYRVSNVTASISILMKKRPALMIQIRKEGTSQQSRKKYKVTQAGIKHIQHLLTNADNE